MSKVLENIRRIRTSNGYSQDQMADLMDVERTTYNNFETGKTRLYSKSFSRFASVMGMSEEEIIFGEKPGLTHGYLQSGNLEDKINSLEEKVEELGAAVGKLSDRIALLLEQSGKSRR
ncbi:MAG: helix-turn-helix transcriptional regulator [Bacteroidales bacterium]|nr:helix-turn-helix transcriptional regulator [Bacteroidales bacterium]